MDIKELQPVLDLMGLQEERLAKKINEVHDTVKEQNNRINEVELDINARSIFCQSIQDEKGRAVIRNRWVIGTLLVILGLLSGLFYKVKEEKKVPVQLIYKDTDSTYIFPDLYFRKPGNQTFTPIHQIFVDINHDKK